MKGNMNRSFLGRASLVKTGLLKQHLFIVLCMLSCHFTFAQTEFDFSTLVGTYTGHPFDIGKGEQEQETEVSIELSANFTLSLSLNRKGDDLEINERLKPKTATIAENGSLELQFEFAHTNRAFTAVTVSLLPASLGYEGVFISFRDDENQYLYFQMNKQGGNPLIPGAAEGLTGQELEKKLHQQFGALFADVEKGFTVRNGEEREGYTLYPSDVYLTHTKPAHIYRRDSGISYYFTQIKKSLGEDQWAYRDSLIQAIESYPSSHGLRVEVIEQRDTVKTYALTRFRKPCGFIQFKEEENNCTFRLFIPLDSKRLKEELTSGFEMAENKFREIQGKKGKAFTFLEEVTTYESARIFYGAYSSLIHRYESRVDWISSFDYYPYAVLAYQLREMDVIFPRVTKAAYEEKGGQFFLRYEKPNMAFEITLADSQFGITKLWISRKKNSNPPVYVTPVKTYAANAEYPAFSGQYEGDDLYLLLGRHWDDPSLRKWLNTPEYGFKKSRNGDSEVCIYDALGIWLTFVKSHLSKVELFKSDSPAFGTFKGKLPKGMHWESTVSSINSSSISWRKQRASYVSYENDGITTQVRFEPEEQEQLSNILIQKNIIADAREDIEMGNLGVGLLFSIHNSGTVSVDNTHVGFAAKKAGIHEGMWILEINGNPVQGKDEYDINKLLKGRNGSTVKVKFCRRYQEENAEEYMLHRGAGGKAELVKAVIPAINLPFNGPYEGDDLFQLLERDFSDPAITAFIHLNAMKKINIGIDSNRKKLGGKGIGLEFYNNTLIKISFSSYAFEGQLPQGLKFGTSPSAIKTSNQLNWTDGGNPYISADYNKKMELRVDFDQNSDVVGAQSTFVYLMLKPKKISHDLVELGFTYGQGKESDIYEVWVLESSPAYKAGVRTDDNVISINGTSITGMNSDDVKKIMLGKKGTTALVVVERDGKEIECTVVR